MDISWYKVVLFIHVGSVVVGMGTAVFFHIQFMRRKLNWGALQNVFHFGSKVIWSGLAVAIVSGIILWIMLPVGQPPLFYGKLALVAMLVIDGIVINKVGRPRLNLLKPHQRFLDLPKEHQRAFYISGVLSVIGWWGALFIAFVV